MKTESGCEYIDTKICTYMFEIVGGVGVGVCVFLSLSDLYYKSPLRVLVGPETGKQIQSTLLLLPLSWTLLRLISSIHTDYTHTPPHPFFYIFSFSFFFSSFNSLICCLCNTHTADYCM